MEQPIATIIASFISGFFTAACMVIAPYVAAHIARERERKALIASTQLMYLEPLIEATRDFRKRFGELVSKSSEQGRLNEISDWFSTIKSPYHKSQEEFLLWCNGEGYYVASTLYLTALYLYYVNTVRTQFPKVLLDPTDSKSLLECLSRVRSSLASNEFGIWETLQSSAGDYLRINDRPMSYPEFCKALALQSERAWFLRVIDFYRDFGLKSAEELNSIVSSLDGLVIFLEYLHGRIGTSKNHGSNLISMK